MGGPARTPYRTVTIPPSRPAAGDTLVVVTAAHAQEPTTRASRAAGALASVGALLLAFVLGAGGWALGLLALVAAVAVWRWRLPVPVSGIVLRADDGKLAVFESPTADVAMLRVPFHEVREVRLDTKTVNRAMREVRPDGILASGHRFTVDESRIVFALAGRDDPWALTEARSSHAECLQWLGKIRSFLRSHGWMPEDERDPSPTRESTP
jgi:hypothetical protein